MKKIFFLLTKYDYPNPCNSFFIDLFKKNFKIFVFGPGYSNLRSYKKTTNYLKNYTNSSDIIITEHQIMTDNYKSLYSNSIIDFDKKKSFEMLRAMKDFFIKTKKKKIFFANFDYFSVPKGLIKNLKISNPIIIHPGIELLNKPSGVNKVLEKNLHNTSDDFYNYLKKNKNKVISFPFYISETESIKKQKKILDVSVLGSRYYNRVIFSNSLKKNKTIKYSFKFTKFNVLIKLNRLLKQKKILIYFRDSFRKEISKSWISFTCGGILNYPVRKFFEIPFFDSMLICKSPKNFKHLGFKNNINFIEVNFTNINNQINELLKNKVKVKKIINNGKKLILNRHTIKYRSGILKRSISKILNDKFKGSNWSNGNFYLK